ncbi:M16 family metallopeptidase [Salinarimonas soli]|uniref:Insulinase family protein n=1 Tax=Salinarimonas soli TaxID=1638099 RepID=A0A5B2V926_9HYPH|nr:pitrilysin family protein [Salinarimonas soli]KAA2235326.1 insulinase family protein [Salinarimonas soli]
MIRALLLILGLALAPSAAFAQTIIQGVTPRGIAYALAPRPANPLVVLSFAWRDGFGEARAGQEGLSGLAAAWHAAGPKGMSAAEFREDLRDDSIGLSLGGGGGRTAGSLSAPPDRLDKAADRLRAVLLEPALDEAALSRLKRSQRASIAQARQTPGSSARTLALMLVAGDTPFVLEHVASARSTIDTIGRADVEAWRRAVLSRDNLVVAAAGPLAEPDLVRLVDRIFGELPERSAVPERPSTAFRGDARTVVMERPVAQTQLVLAGGTGLRTHDADETLRSNLANQAFSSGPASRLFRSVREELGATYGSQSSFVTLGDEAAVFMITSAVDHALAGRALAALREQYARFHRDGITEAELAPLRARAANGAEEGLVRSEVAGALRNAMTRGRNPAEVAAMSRRIAAATAPEVNAVIRERLPAPPLTTVIVAPSAEGFSADCVVRRDQALEACLEP